MHGTTCRYNAARDPDSGRICDLLARRISANLPDAQRRGWHVHPEWFIEVSGCKGV